MKAAARRGFFHGAVDDAAGGAGLTAPRESAQASFSSGTWRPLLLAAPSLCTAEAAGQATAAGFACGAEAAPVACAAQASSEIGSARASRRA